MCGLQSEKYGMCFISTPAKDSTLEYIFFRANLNPPPARDEAAKLNEELLEACILETRNLKDVLCSPISQQTMNQGKVILDTLNFLSKQRHITVGPL